MSQPQTFVLRGKLDTSTVDQNKNLLQRPFGLLRLVNAFTHMRRGGVVKRGGSETETITTGLGLPLGIGIVKKDTASDLMPIEGIPLANFGGSAFYKKTSGSWSSITLNANTNFDTTKQTKFAQLGNVVAIAGGRPARTDTGLSQIERMGYPAPSTAITYTTSAGSLSPLYGYQWVYTYYNSTTGKESDWSPLSTASGAQTSKQFDLTIPTTSPGSTADKKRIYRNADGATTFRLVTTIDVATGTYTDNTADTSLGTEIPTLYKNKLPPDESFIVIDYASRFWFNDTASPKELVCSEPYIGSDNDVEYFAATNRIPFPHEVTGAVKTNSAMYVFGIRNISRLTGSDFTTFNRDDFKDGVGTLFPHSIASNGDTVVFLGESGFKAIIAGRVEHISNDIDEELSPLLQGSYNYFVYVSAIWHEALRAFILAVSASSGEGTPWVLSATGFPASWKLSSTGETEFWQIPGAPAEEEATTRIKMWGWEPESGEWFDIEIPQCTDNNNGGYGVISLVAPYPSSTTFDPQQEMIFLGYTDSDGGKILGLFRNDRSKDDATNISAKVITDRIQPGRPDSRYRRFRHLLLEGTYLDITSGGGTIKYILDFDDPHIRDYSSALYTFSGSGDKKVFTQGKGRFFHLEIVDETERSNNILLEKFTVDFIEKYLREGR